jgi:hypothetical protein
MTMARSGKRWPKSASKPPRAGTDRRVTLISALVSIPFGKSVVNDGWIFYSDQAQPRRRRLGALCRIPVDCGTADGGGQSRLRHLAGASGAHLHVAPLRSLCRRLLYSSAASRDLAGMDGKILFRILHGQRQLQACSELPRAIKLFTRAFISE